MQVRALPGTPFDAPPQGVKPPHNKGRGQIFHPLRGWLDEIDDPDDDPDWPEWLDNIC